MPFRRGHKISRRKNKRFANLGQGNPARGLRERGSETFDWFAKRFDTEFERLVMDRHDEACLGMFAIAMACSGVQWERIHGL